MSVRAGAIAATSIGGLDAIAAASIGRFGLHGTALGLTLLAILVARDPTRGIHRLLADGIVTIVLGALALLFR